MISPDDRGILHIAVDVQPGTRTEPGEDHPGRLDSEAGRPPYMKLISFVVIAASPLAGYSIRMAGLHGRQYLPLLKRIEDLFAGRHPPASEDDRTFLVDTINSPLRRQRSPAPVGRHDLLISINEQTKREAVPIHESLVRR